MLDRQDLERFVDEYADHAYNFAYSLCENVPEAQELVQHAFVKLFESADRFDASQSLESWYCTILKNVFRDSRRRWERRYGVSLDTPIDAEGLTVADALPDSREQALLDRLVQDETGAVVRKAFETLPPKSRMVLTMVDVDGMGYEEVARALDWPLGTVRSRVNRGRALLRAKLMRREVAV